MQSIAALTEQVKTILIQMGGQQPRHEVYNRFINECNSLSLTEDDFYKRVLAPASRSINWEQVEEEKKANEAKEKAEQAAALKLEVQQSLLVHINRQLQSAFGTGVVEAAELKEIFDKAESSYQDIDQLANYIYTQIGKYDFKPYPAADTTQFELKDRLLSTNWYDSWHYNRLNTPVQPQPAVAPATPSPKPQQAPQKASSGKGLLTALLVLVLVGGSLFYLLWLRPYLKDKNAVRKYSFAEQIALRSSQSATTDANITRQINYGTELLVYEETPEWAKVKVNEVEGYVSDKYLLNKQSFYELNSIFGDETAKEIVATTRCRKALLDYFQQHNMIGKIDSSVQKDLFGSVQQKEAWQLFTREKKPTSVIYTKAANAGAKFKDFGFIITNLATQKRRFVLYSFSDTEDPQFVYEEEAPDAGYILSVSKSFLTDRPYVVKYSKG